MGTYAAENAISDAGIERDEIDFIIFSTLSPDYYFPGSGVLLQRNLKIKEISIRCAETNVQDLSMDYL